jgi:hypothetical protein
MSHISLDILRNLEKEGEMTISDIAFLLPKRHGDHRDFYPFASLIVQGLVEDSSLEKDTMDRNPNYTSFKLQTVAWRLFASDADYEAEYKNVKWLRSKDRKFRDELYTLTGNGYLYLNENRIKRDEKRFTLLIAIFSAVFATALTYLLYLLQH